MSRIRLKTPEGLELSRDPHGIPQIDAADLYRLHWGMGACHALDRGLQMQLMRILGQGRAAELLDDTEAMVDVDRFFLRMNWRGGCAEEASRLKDRTRELCDQYVHGINAGFEHRWPWELRLLRIRREPWTVADLILISRMTGYLTLAQSQGEIERFFVELVQAGVDDARLEALFPFATAEVDRELLSKVQLGERIVPEALKWLSPAPRAMASNNWVVAASRTASGKPLMANDPHLETNRLPAVWVEQSYRWPGGWGLFAGMPGLPAALVGRSQNVAWGATYTFMDALDSWVEECRDGAYRREDEWKPFHVRTETIVRKKHPDVHVRFYENDHGVLDGDPNKEGFYLATRWAPGDSGAVTLDAAAEAWNVRTVEEGRGVLGRIETAWNWVFADADGHIGYQMSGRLPRRAPGVSGFVPRKGSDPAFDWQEWVPYEELPRCMDPEAGYIITANQDLNHFGAVRAINAPMGDYRARRIADLLSEDEAHTVESSRRIQMDLFSLQAESFMRILRPLLGPSANQRLLAEWDLRYTTDSLGASVFEAFYAACTHTFFEPWMGEAVVRHLLDKTSIFIDFYATFDQTLLDPESPWLGERSQQEVFAKALTMIEPHKARPWGEANRFVQRHLLFGGKLPRFLGFDHGPLPLAGGRATPHQGQLYSNGGRETSFAPSLRVVTDLAEDAMHTVLAGGPSDRRFSGLYTNEVKNWIAGRLKVRRPIGDSGATS